MTSEVTGRRSWWSRNQWPLIVGAVALVALLGWGLVAIDRFSDDEERFDEQVEGRPSDDSGEVTREGERPRLSDERAEFIAGFLAEMVAGGAVLGVSLVEWDGGLLVEQVFPGTPAREAGLRPGDVLRELDGERVRDVADLREALSDLEPGERYELGIDRAGEPVTLEVVHADVDLVVAELRDWLEGLSFVRPDVPRRQLEHFPDQRPEFNQPGVIDDNLHVRPILGVTVREANEGLRVMTVAHGSAALYSGFNVGDVITKVGRQRVRTTDELEAALPVFDLSGDELPDEIGDAVEFTVLRDGRELELEVVFSIRPGNLTPVAPPATAVPAVPGNDALERLMRERLERIEQDLLSDDFIEVLAARVIEELAPLLVPPPDQATEEAVPTFDLATALTGLNVYSGSVSELGDASIVLAGTRGSIRLTITDETVFAGSSPRIGGVAAVIVDADLNAVLVVVGG